MDTSLELIENEIALDYDIDAKEDTSSNELFACVKQINESIKYVNRQVVDREEMVRQAFYALLTGEHQLLLSRTGMAKSLLARQIFCCFKNANVFEKQLTKDTMPDNLFGAYDIDEMKKGKMIHNVEGSIVLADFAFLDEIFDANDMLLRSLLSLLNEKRLVNGQQQLRSTLNSVIGATNYLRATEMLEAVLDRFLYKSYIPENKNLYTQLAIDRIYQQNYGTATLPEHKIDLNDFIVLRKVVKSQTLKIPEYILFLKNYILRRYIEETRAQDPNQANFTISDRTSVKIQDLLRASAILDFRMEVEEKDLDQIYYLVSIVGKKEEKDRLSNIIETARRYFGPDRKILEDIFQLMQVIREIRFMNGDKNINKSQKIVQTMEEIESTLKDKRGLRAKLQHITGKIIPFTNKSEKEKMSDSIMHYCDLLKQMADKKETLEIIDGLIKDIEFLRAQTLLN